MPVFAAVAFFSYFLHRLKRDVDQEKSFRAQLRGVSTPQILAS